MEIFILFTCIFIFMFFEKGLGEGETPCSCPFICPTCDAFCHCGPESSLEVKPFPRNEICEPPFGWRERVIDPGCSDEESKPKEECPMKKFWNSPTSESLSNFGPIFKRRNREIDDTEEFQILPNLGTWYKDISTNKFYYHFGNSVYILRYSPFYTKWVRSGEDSEWSLNDNYLYTWDDTGKWYPDKEDDGEKPSSCQKPPPGNQIPIECIANNCPNQIKYPSNGVWYINGDNFYIFDNGEEKYEFNNNKFFTKLVGGKKVCPNNWTWDCDTGEWMPAPAKSKETGCFRSDPRSSIGNPSLIDSGCSDDDSSPNKKCETKNNQKSSISHRDSSPSKKWWYSPTSKWFGPYGPLFRRNDELPALIENRLPPNRQLASKNFNEQQLI